MDGAPGDMGPAGPAGATGESGAAGQPGMDVCSQICLCILYSYSPQIVGYEG